ncbi:MAG TPA: YihY/virulence factor BrkB family protein [Trebonia sp.]|nr:YihY/virulence factor BrkB family protein [Trebonia sp.]
MNPAERLIRKADAAQQRHRASAFAFGVVKKFGDDNGGVLVANLTHSAFVSLFPLLLVLVTILGLVAAGDPSFRQAAINAVAGQFPLIGHELTNVRQLRRSSLIGLIAGLLWLVWGSTGLAQAGLFTMEQVWNLPGPARPGYVPRLGRALLFLGLLGSDVIATTLLAALSAYGNRPQSLAAFAYAVQATVNSGMYFAGFRILTPRGVPSRDLAPGAVAAGILWTALQVAGTYVVGHYLHSDSVYGVFATVLGLVTWLYLAAEVTVYSAEINVVLARRLWPRALVQPPLTEADRASMALQALQNQRREEQHVEVTFNDREPGAKPPPITPRTPEEVSPPATGERPERPR